MLIVDRDGRADRRDKLDAIEQRAAAYLGSERERIFLAENAWQEIEVWVLAGMRDLPAEWRWKGIRAEPNPKEVYFEPYAQRRGFAGRPFGGRVTLGKEAAGRYKRIVTVCAEDVARLEKRLRARLTRPTRSRPRMKLRRRSPK